MGLCLFRLYTCSWAVIYVICFHVQGTQIQATNYKIYNLLAKQIDLDAFWLYFAKSSYFIEHSLDTIYVLSNHCCEQVPKNICT